MFVLILDESIILAFPDGEFGSQEKVCEDEFGNSINKKICMLEVVLDEARSEFRFKHVILKQKIAEITNFTMRLLACNVFDVISHFPVFP